MLDGRVREGLQLLRLFRTALALCFLATLLLSHRLWLTGGRDYPLAPVIDGIAQIPYPLDRLIFGGMVVALAGMAISPRPRPWIITVLAISIIWLIFDQTRWQPYIVTYIVGAASLLLGERRADRGTSKVRALWHMAPFQILLCATWIYSGLHKLNLRYLEVDFPVLMRPLWTRMGISPEALFWPGLASAVLEAGLGLALLSRRSRRFAVLGLTGMHGVILLIIGPLAPRNSVVWPWNIAVVAALWTLFWPRAESEERREFVPTWRMLRGKDALGASCRVSVVLFAILPAFSFVDLWPASLSFQMYSGKQRDVRIRVAPEHREALPLWARRAERSPGEVNLALWSMREMNVTPIMDTRVVASIGNTLARRAPVAEVRVFIKGSPRLLTGERTMRVYSFRGRP